MGSSSSTDRSPRQPSRSNSSSFFGRYYDDSQAQYLPNHQNNVTQPPLTPDYAPQPAYPPPQQYYAPYQSFNGRAGEPQRRLDRRYSRIADDYSSLEQVTEALSHAGLESSNLIVGIDFTKSNEWTGRNSFNKRCLHHIGNDLNPYEQAISIIGKTLAAFDEDNLIPCFGFGDASTHDQDVFSFYPEDRFCEGFEEVLSRYREIAPQLRLAGPTSFAPVIEMAMTTVAKGGGQYHVLLIIADGQVTRSVDTERGQLSPQEQRTVEAIVAASTLPLSIILVGVGDGPWDMMREFDDNIPARAFDNFQFVNFTEIMSKKTSQTRKETEFALAALMEIPSQYKATIELNLLGQKVSVCERVSLPPPIYNEVSYGRCKPPRQTSFQQSAPPYYPGESVPAGTAPPATSSTYENQLCPICLTNAKDMAFGCGHQTCCECGQGLQSCPMCRSPIHTRIKLY